MDTLLNPTLLKPTSGNNPHVDWLHSNYTSESRLYTFKLRDSADLSAWLEGDELLVAAFASQDQLHGIAETDILVLARQLDLPLTKLIGRVGQFDISLANGQRSHQHGLITQAHALGSDGGLVRYQLRLSSWLSLLTHTAQSRVWQEQSTEHIVNSILTDYSPHAHWQWSEDAHSLLQTLPVRSYCIQYRETPFAFISRLLAEDGLSWRTAHHHPDAPDQHSLIFFADSRVSTSCEDNPDQANTGNLSYTYPLTAPSTTPQYHPAIRVRQYLYRYFSESCMASIITHRLCVLYRL